jgi:hypothetical protein
MLIDVRAFSCIVSANTLSVLSTAAHTHFRDVSQLELARKHTRAARRAVRALEKCVLSTQ